MIPFRSKIKTTLGSLVLAAAIAAGGLGATPVLAQDGPGFEFSIEMPGGNERGQGDFNTFGRHGNDRFNDGPQFGFRCLTNREVREGVADYGFRRVQITHFFHGDRVEVTGEYRNRLYSMRVDKCTGEVDRIARIRNGRGVELNFNFGN